MELDPKDHPYYGFGEPTSIIVVYLEPLGYKRPPGPSPIERPLTKAWYKARILFSHNPDANPNY